MTISPTFYRTLLGPLALAGATACSSRFKVDPTQGSADTTCSPPVTAQPPSAPATTTPPLSASAGVDGVDAANLTAASTRDAHSGHDCADDGAPGPADEPARSSSPDGSTSSPSQGAADTSSEGLAEAPSTSDSGGPFVKPPLVPTPGPPTRAAVTYAVMISIDGLAARFLEQVIEAGNAPTFKALQSLAAWTHNARSDKTYTITLPNHTCMLTGLPVSPSPGFESFRSHRWTNNWDPLPTETLHPLRLPERDYTPSVFDVAHDRGKSTALFASKTKFSLFSQSYNDAGAPDLVGEDNGRRKIDTVVLDIDPALMVDKLVATLSTSPANYTFVHFNQPDGAGHSIGWGSPEYLAAVASMDLLLGRVLATVQSGTLAGKTALIVTTDHGGVDWGHNDSADVRNFQIPFYVMAPGVAPGDAYAVFANRFAPDLTNPEYMARYQPLRNGDSGNLALYLLGLPPIPESIIHSAGIRIRR